MLTEKRIEVASKFYKARKAMKFLRGDKYPESVKNTAEVIQKVADAHNCDIIPATQICIEKVVEKFPYDNGIHVAMLLATAVEMIEGNYI